MKMEVWLWLYLLLMFICRLWRYVVIATQTLSISFNRGDRVDGFPACRSLITNSRLYTIFSVLR